MTVSELSQAEKIEYYLGKDSFKDIYFKPEFPHAYEVPIGPLTVNTMTSITNNFNKIWKPELMFKINNLGYRSDEDFSVEKFKDKKLVLCLGCTDTFGIHDVVDKVWPGILNNSLEDYEVLNLGIIGASRDTISRILIKLIAVLPNEIKHICILWPHPGRREFISKLYTNVICSHDKITTPYDEYWDFIDWKSNNYNHFKNQHLIFNLCEKNNINMLGLEIDRFDKKLSCDYSGDHFAFGEHSHTAIAEYFRKKILGVPSLYEIIKNDYKM